MPTTPSSADSVRSAWRCWTTREIGVTRCAKRHVRYATAGIATPAQTREQRVDDQQDDRGADDHHRALAHLDDAPADEVAHRVEVVRRAREHLAGRVPVVEGARIGQVRREQPPAHLVLDLDADARGQVAALVVDEQPDHGEHRDAAEVRPQVARVPRHDRVVDRALHEPGDRERRDRHAERREQAERGQPPLVAPEPEEAARGRAEGQIGWVVGVVCHECGQSRWRGRLVARRGDARPAAVDQSYGAARLSLSVARGHRGQRSLECAYSRAWPRCPSPRAFARRPMHDRPGSGRSQAESVPIGPIARHPSDR